MKKDENRELNRYAMSGMAAFVPGMQYMVELMQRQLDEFRAELARLQGMDEAPSGRPPSGRARGAKRAWAGMTPEERSAEMKRRIKISAEKREKRRLAKLHPRDEARPGHAKWMAGLRKAARSNWDNKTTAEKKAHLAKMNAGRTKKARAARKARKAAAAPSLALSLAS